MKKTFNFGKIDYYGRGRKINLVEVDGENYYCDAVGRVKLK